MSEEKKLFAALAKAQRVMKPAAFDCVNPHFRSKYASLASVFEALREPLAANGLCVMQKVAVAQGQVAVTTILAHESGESEESTIAIPVTKADAQGVAAATTYGRRIGVAALCGVVSDEDDDGNAAVGKPAETAKPAAPKPAPVAAVEKVLGAAPADVDVVPVVPFGKHKGVPLRDLPDKSLSWYADKATKDLADAAQAKFHEERRGWLTQLEDEMDRRAKKKGDVPF